MPPSVSSDRDRVLNVLPSPETHRDWTTATAEAAEVLAAPAAALPTSVDLREDWWAIGDQGQTGSCVGWASADSLLRWHFVTAGRLGRRTRLSVRFQWMASKEIDIFRQRPTSFVEIAGTSLKSALDVSRRWGAVRDADLPFGQAALWRGAEDELYARASRLKIASYFNLGVDAGAWRRWLAQHGPVMVRLDVDDAFYDAAATSGVLRTYNGTLTYGGHAVALVGYTSRRFIVRNSWGTTWGDGGFAYATNAYATNAFTEAYGVVL
jgi:C1A family cysteine protease